MQTIAIINLSPIGDVINTSPVCHELRKNFPNAKLIYITLPRSREIAKCIPEIDEVLVFDKKDKHKGFKILNFALSCRLKYKIDIAVILNETLRSALLAFLIGAKKRVGRISEKRGLLLTHKLPHKKEEIDLQIHASEHYMRVLTPLGLYNSCYDLNLKYDQEDKEFIEQLLKQMNISTDNLIGLCPCTALDEKDLNPEEIAKFINFINQETNFKIVIIGTEKAKIFVQNLQNVGVNDFIDLTCKINIPQLLALVSKFKILVSTDSAPMHMGFALKIPTICVFMRGSTKKWGPRNNDINSLIYEERIISGETIIKEFLAFTNKLQAKQDIFI